LLITAGGCCFLVFCIPRLSRAPGTETNGTEDKAGVARIIPSDLTRLALSGAHEPEIETLALLRDTLPDEYTVFHGVHWTRQYKGRTLFGEIDFMVLN
jgi:hypothetical protein